MKCPACERELTQQTVGGPITVDVCVGGCGGIWFDPWELQKVDAAEEADVEALLRVDRDPTVTVDLTARRSCPRDVDIVMQQHFYSVQRRVTVDECPGCAGYWLDAGELAAIRSEFATDQEREAAARAYFSEMFDQHVAAMGAAGQAKVAKARQIAHLFRFICPTYYIPGKQDWGAF